MISILFQFINFMLNTLDVQALIESDFTKFKVTVMFPN